MSVDHSNPYAVSPLAEPLDKSFRRPLSSGLVAVVHVVGYLMQSLWGGLLLVILPLGGFTGARTDEYALGVMAILFVPVCVWLSREEIRCFRAPGIDRERRLSRMAMLTTVAPVLMSAFWFSEYLVFGSYQANGIPAIWAAVFSLFWCASGAYRFLRVAALAVDAQ